MAEVGGSSDADVAAQVHRWTRALTVALARWDDVGARTAQVNLDRARDLRRIAPSANSAHEANEYSDDPPDYGAVTAALSAGDRAGAWSLLYNRGDTAKRWARRVKVLADEKSLDWVKNGERFLMHLRSSMERLPPPQTITLGPPSKLPDAVTALGTPEAEFGLGTVAFAESDSYLLDPLLSVILLANDRIAFELVGKLPYIRDEDKDLWEYLILDAIDRLHRHAGHLWVSVLGGVDTSLMRRPSLRLKHPARIGPLTVGSAPVAIRIEKSNTRALGAFDLTTYTPALVTGVCDTLHDWGLDAGEEGEQVRRVCALLSIALDRCWLMIQTPSNTNLPEIRDQEVRTEIWSIALNASSDRLERRFELVEEPTNEQVVSVADWVDAAWGMLDDDAPLSRSLDAYYEALQLLERHPSVALVLLNAVLDSMGARLGLKTSGKRVRGALDAALGEEEAKRLHGAYDLRNATAHEGTLHGLENMFGLMVSRHLEEGRNDIDFRLSLLEPTAKACRTLLLGELQRPR